MTMIVGINNFCQKASSKMHDEVLNMSLLLQSLENGQEKFL